MYNKKRLLKKLKFAHFYDHFSQIHVRSMTNRQNNYVWKATKTGSVGIRNDVSFIFLSWVICTSVFTKLYVEIDALKNMFDIFFVSLIKVQEVCRRGV